MPPHRVVVVAAARVAPLPDVDQRVDHPGLGVAVLQAHLEAFDGGLADVDEHLGGCLFEAIVGSLEDLDQPQDQVALAMASRTESAFSVRGGT